MGRDGKELIFIADRDMEQAQDKCGQVVRRSCDVIVVVVATPFLSTSVSTSVWHPDNVGTMCFLWTLLSSKFRFWPMCNSC